MLTTNDGTASRVRVLIQSSDGEDHWGTVGVSSDIIEASWLALVDSIVYGLLKRANWQPLEIQMGPEFREPTAS